MNSPYDIKSYRHKSPMTLQHVITYDLICTYIRYMLDNMCCYSPLASAATHTHTHTHTHIHKENTQTHVHT